MAGRLWTTPEAFADLLLAAGLIVLGVSVFAAALTLPPPFFDPLGSAAVPKFVSGLLVGLAVLLLVQRRRSTAAADDPAEFFDDPVASAPLVALGAVLIPIAYVAIMHVKILGFAPASSIFVIALGSLLARFESRTMIALVPIGLIVGYGLNYLFTQILYIDLPQTSRLFGG